MPIYEYKCPKGHISEILNSVENRHASQFCRTPGCGQLAKFITSAPNLDPKMGVDPDMPTMADKWAKKHEKEGRKRRDERQQS